MEKPEVQTPGLLKLRGRQPCRMATAATLCFLHHKHNMLQKYADIVSAGLTQKMRVEPLAIAGGGPSLQDTLEVLRHFPGHRMAAGSSHDFLVKSGIRLDYCIVIDPDPISALYLEEDGDDCLYLLASHVAPECFWKLQERGKKIAIFGAGGTLTEEQFDPVPVVGVGGRTVGTRAMGMALALGYREFHIFGMDSCLKEDKSHAYDWHVKDDSVKPSAMPIYCNGRKFMCAPYMAGQATDFQHFMGTWGNQVGVAVYGDGLIAEIMKAGAAIQSKELADG